MALVEAVRPRIRPAASTSFVIFTDNETWAGSIHTAAAWKKYRAKNPSAKLVVASTAANTYTVGDPQDESVLQVCGFDASIFRVIESFIGRAEPEASE